MIFLWIALVLAIIWAIAFFILHLAGPIIYILAILVVISLLIRVIKGKK